MNLRRWLLHRLLDWDTPIQPFEYTPDDKLNLGQFCDDDAYRSFRKVLENTKYQAMREGFTTGDTTHAKGQYLASLKIENTIKRFNAEYRRKKKSS